MLKLIWGYRSTYWGYVVRGMLVLGCKPHVIYCMEGLVSLDYIKGYVVFLIIRWGTLAVLGVLKSCINHLE